MSPSAQAWDELDRNWLKRTVPTSLPSMSTSPPTSLSSKDAGKRLSESEYDLDFEKRTIRYVDWRIIPILAIVFSVGLIDRLNLGVAYAAGMGADLALDKGIRFNLIICLYFVPVVALQLPGNLVLRKFGVRNWLTFNVIAWGAVQLGMGFVSAWYWLVLCRVLLGAFEASLLPSLIFVLTTWYKRHEVQTRLAYFFTISSTAAALGPILGYAFSLLDGQGNLAGWRWIFIIEGVITLASGILTWVYIPDFADKNTFLTADQTAMVLKRINDDRGDAIPDELTAKKVKEHLLDWTLWAYGIMFTCLAIPGYSQGYFLPIILKEMGWSGTQAILLSSAPASMVVVGLLVAYIADRRKHRAGFIMLMVITCMVGIALLAFAEAVPVRYFGSFLIAAGNAACTPGVLAYAANNVVSHSKRSVQTALQISLGSIGAIIGTLVFRAKDAPRYIPGLVTALASQGLFLLVLLITTLHFWRKNKLMRSGATLAPLENQPGFYYTL